MASGSSCEESLASTSALADKSAPEFAIVSFSLLLLLSTASASCALPVAGAGVGCATGPPSKAAERPERAEAMLCERALWRMPRALWRRASQVSNAGLRRWLKSKLKSPACSEASALTGFLGRPLSISSIRCPTSPDDFMKRSSSTSTTLSSPSSQKRFSSALQFSGSPLVDTSCPRSWSSGSGCTRSASASETSACTFSLPASGSLVLPSASSVSRSCSMKAKLSSIGPSQL
mmetsp:Transcript_26989/g.48791  ORF Transcript_26989/g.48791 Transcript_26989/m.48791 type:complete len:233 (-) Transcript_26989:117-815(-)